MEVLFVIPDYYTDYPKACMDAWGRRFLLIAPDGFVLPCHAAHRLPGPEFERAGKRPLAATDPVCRLAPGHDLIEAARAERPEPAAYVYRPPRIPAADARSAPGDGARPIPIEAIGG